MFSVFNVGICEQCSAGVSHKKLECPGWRHRSEQLSFMHEAWCAFWERWKAEFSRLVEGR